jgi:HlyD family secretion protein
MNKGIILGIGALLVGGGAWAFLATRGSDEGEIEYRYAPVATGELRRSITATGQLVALTDVDVKSKAGGKIVRLVVDEGTFVRRGDLIAIIDPSDTRAVYDQAAADVRQAQARASQARVGYEHQVGASQTAVSDAQAQLEAARVRLEKARLEADRQPKLIRASIESARAAFEAAQEEMRRLEQVTIPQKRRDAQSNVTRTQSELAAAEADNRRQTELYDKGFVSKAVVERARSAFEAARANYDIARQRLDTIDKEVSADLQAQRLQVARTQSALQEAEANSTQTALAVQTLRENEKAVRLAEIALQRARNDIKNNEMRRADITAAQAAAVRSKVSLDNAKVQLDSTTVVAPRDGVVTLKYLEEGTIIPPGMSTFAQGTSIVQISDVTKMFVECAVDEADVSHVAEGQRVRIRTESYPGKQIEGVVRRVNPAAQTEQNITAIKVRVEVYPAEGVTLLPGMNATCEFITMSKPDVLIAPAQAVEREEGKAFVKVKGQDPMRPVRREVQVGETGNEGIEILSGVQEGEEIVIAEIDLKQLRETQQKMLEAMEGGGLATGGPRPGGRSMGGAGGGSGARPGGGGGGGGR